MKLTDTFSSGLSENDITDELAFLNRRQLLRQLGFIGADACWPALPIIPALASWTCLAGPAQPLIMFSRKYNN